MHVIQWRSLSRNVVYCTCFFVGCSLKSLYSPNSSSELLRFERSKQTTARYPDSGLNWKTTQHGCACSIEVDTLLRTPDWTWKFRNSHLLQQPLLCVWSNLEKPQWMYSFRVNSYSAIWPESIWESRFFSTIKLPRSLFFKRMLVRFFKQLYQTGNSHLTPASVFFFVCVFTAPVLMLFRSTCRTSSQIPALSCLPWKPLSKSRPFPHTSFYLNMLLPFIIVRNQRSQPLSEDST